MKEQLQALLEFHRTFGAYIADHPTADIPPRVRELRIRLIEEELAEYAEAARAGDLVGIADALIDLLYVVLGAVVAHGLHEVAEALFAEVHRSNMSKAGPHGRPLRREDGKILKPPSFSPPDLHTLLAPWIAQPRKQESPSSGNVFKGQE